jgi:hypothetical protein
LVVNPLLIRDLPPPGWIGDHRETWVQQHPVYNATCENIEVIKEIRFLNRVIAYDEYLLSLPDSPDSANPIAARLAKVAKQTMTGLRRDIVTADVLVVQLRLLPGCAAARPAAAMMASAMPTQPAQKASAALATAEPQPPRGEPAPPAKEANAAPASAIETAAAAPDRLVIRFDDKQAALTPSGIRAFNEAVAATRSGKKVQLAIEGCDAGADFSNGSACARRLASIERRLAANGVRDPKRLFADLR